MHETMKSHIFIFFRLFDCLRKFETFLILIFFPCDLVEWEKKDKKC